MKLFLLGVMLIACSSPSWCDAGASRVNLEMKTGEELRLMRNEVFARHGRIFDDPGLRRYFEAQPWYRPSSNYSDSLLTEEERKLVAEIAAIEARRRKPVVTSTEAAWLAVDNKIKQFENGNEYLDWAIATSSRAVVPQGGIPSNIGGYALGKTRKGCFTSEMTLFLGLPGGVRSYCDESGRLTAIEFSFAGAPFRTDREEEIFLPALARLVGRVHEKVGEAYVWEDGKRRMTMRISEHGEVSVLVQAVSPTMPGGPGDGFRAFMIEVCRAFARGDIDSASESFLYPFEDHIPWTGASDEETGQPPRSMTMGDKEEFRRKFAQLREQILFPECSNFRPENFSEFYFPDTYVVRLGPRDLIVRRMGKGKWKIAGVPAIGG